MKSIARILLGAICLSLFAGQTTFAKPAHSKASIQAASNQKSKVKAKARAKAKAKAKQARRAARHKSS